jgi:hypothetical protein
MRTLGFLLALLLPAPAFAQESASATFDTSSGLTTEGLGADAPGPLVIGAEIGAIFPQPFSELDTHVAFGIELGYKLPFWGQRLEIMGAAGFSPPGNSEKIEHGSPDSEQLRYKTEITQQMLFFSLGPRLRVMEASSPWNMTIAAGGRLFLLRTYSNGSREGEKFAEFTEQSTKFGFFVALGGEYRLGPGAIFLDVDLGWSKLDHKITGDVSTGNISPTLGYRFFLL